MLTIEPLGLSANQWQFLSRPEEYVKASIRSRRELVLESTRRQFLTAQDILARLNGSHGEPSRRGILLADDVGLGKTSVAALVAWVVASAGEKRGVRILAPNDVVMRRWEDELLSQVRPLQECAPALEVRAKRVKVGKVRLSAGSIQVVKHSYAASDFNLTCDLLIVDEAHRAKGENTAFSSALKRQRKHARRVLILTATPFSICLKELKRMLSLIGGDAAHAAVRAFSKALGDLYSGSTSRDQDVVAERLAAKAIAAVDALSPFVIRHGINDLPREQASFGRHTDWNIEVPEAKPEEVELMVRMDRILRVLKDDKEWSKATNDPRFHVGWGYFDEVRDDLNRKVARLAQPSRVVVENHLKSVRQLRAKVGTHSKIDAVAVEAKAIIEKNEKIVFFCHHHATAQELTVHLDKVLQIVPEARLPSPKVWTEAWRRVLATANQEEHEDETLRETFVKWLCSDLIRAQTRSWLPAGCTSAAEVAHALQRISARRQDGGRETIAEGARRLYRTLLQSKSSRAVLKAAEKGLNLLPGVDGKSRVVGLCKPIPYREKKELFIHNQQPDTMISVFNSPFGPDVLVVTDKLSEGIDLHRYCRHLIHYELDSSPIRTVQRNGRLRRVNSWASATDEPILYSYPAFRGTRDHRLVQIMKKRINSFSLLLGGVQDFDVEEIVGSEERWRNKVIALAKTRLSRAGGRLQARDPTRA